MNGTLIVALQTFDTVKQPLSNGHHQPIPTFSVAPSDEPPRPQTPPPVDYSVAREDSVEYQQQPYQPPPVPTVIVAEHSRHTPTPPAAISEPPSPVAVAQPTPPAVVKPIAVYPREPSPARAPVVVTKENPINEQLLTENKDLRSEIEDLKRELAIKYAEQEQQASELRQRRRSSDSRDSVPETDVRTAVEEPQIQQDGVPLNVVVLISFTVFFMTYIFF